MCEALRMCVSVKEDTLKSAYMQEGQVFSRQIHIRNLKGAFVNVYNFRPGIW